MLHYTIGPVSILVLCVYYFRQFFTAKVFSKLLKDDPLGRYVNITPCIIPYGTCIHVLSHRVAVTQVFSYIMRKGERETRKGS